MFAGGGGEPGPATSGNQTAVLSCSIYATYKLRGEGGEVVLPARSFLLEVSERSNVLTVSRSADDQ